MWGGGQAVDHPYRGVHSASSAAAAAAAAALPAGEGVGAPEEEAAATGMCGVCHDPLEQPVLAACGHAFCRVPAQL